MTGRQQPDWRTRRLIFIEPMACLAVAHLPEGEAWEYELKFDGYRALGIKTGGIVQLISRNGKNLSRRFATISRALQSLPDETTIDGEVVALDEAGRPSFSLLQNSRSQETVLAYYAFDLLHLPGASLVNMPLHERREQLRSQVMPLLSEPLRYSETFQTSASQLIEGARELGFEGVVAKRLDGVYESGRRSGAWVKLRLNRGQEFVVGGYVPAGDSFDSIIFGYYEGKDLKYAARVRNGFVPHSREALLKRLRGLQREGCPFSNLPETRKGRWGEGLTAQDMENCRWVEPRLVVFLEFVEWTAANHLRHVKFVGLREDQAAHEVGRESG
jgi:bifunctional non-homologous end joining protein LigD